MSTNNRVYGTGKRKTAVARVWLSPGSGKMTVNGVEADKYFEREDEPNDRSSEPRAPRAERSVRCVRDGGWWRALGAGRGRAARRFACLDRRRCRATWQLEARRVPDRATLARRSARSRVSPALASASSTRSVDLGSSRVFAPRAIPISKHAAATSFSREGVVAVFISNDSSNSVDWAWVAMATIRRRFRDLRRDRTFSVGGWGEKPQQGSNLGNRRGRAFPVI